MSSTTHRTVVCIVGGGPAGLLLARLLSLQRIKSVILECRSRAYVEQRQRAGILEQGTIEALRMAKASERMDKLGILHHGVQLLFDRQRHRIDFPAFTDGRSVMIWPQTEVCQDLIRILLEEDYPLHFESQVIAIDGVTTQAPKVTFQKDGGQHTIACDYVAGCDGFWGVSRASIPETVSRVYEKQFPFSWLGVMANAPPSSDELIYARSPRGFALLSMRSEAISRHYIQVPNDTDAGSWSDEDFWDELERRTATVEGFTINRGEITSKTVTPMRSFVHEPMQYRRLYLAGDSAHIVPPTGAKGLNLAVGDVLALATAFNAAINTGSSAKLNAYSDTCLDRVWQAERFSFETTTMLHAFSDASSFDEKLAVSKLKRIVTNDPAKADFALGYTGFPFTAGNS